jgi:GTPase SAR1 family protein
LRILVLGLDNAGKTTVVRRLLGQPIDKIQPTLGFSIQTLTYRRRHGNNDDDSLRLHLWDIGGQKTIRSYWRNYFDGQIDGIIWVVDSIDNELTTRTIALFDVVITCQQTRCDRRRFGRNVGPALARPGQRTTALENICL